MPHARLTLTVPEGLWIGTVTRRHPDVTVRVLAALPGEDVGVGLVEILAPNLEAVVADIAEFEQLRSLDVLQETDGRALVQFETSMFLPLEAAREAGVPLETPFEIRDGKIHWALTASHERLSELGDSLDALGISFEVESLQTAVPESGTLLTDRQRRIVTAAVEAGYYDTPRECSLTELAERLDLAKSTASETLHRAEEAIVKEFVDSLDEAAIQTE